MDLSVTAAAAIAGLDALGKRLDDVTKQITADAAHLVQAESMRNAPVGDSGNSTNAPGDLRRSIDVEGPTGSSGAYLALVGPTTVYGRQRELGGDIYPKRARALRFTKFGDTVYTAHVYQAPNPYMSRGEAAAIPKIAAVAYARLRAALAQES